MHQQNFVEKNRAVRNQDSKKIALRRNNTASRIENWELGFFENFIPKRSTIPQIFPKLEPTLTMRKSTIFC